MRAADLATAAILAALAGVVLYDAVRLGIGWGDDGPRSGFFPFWLAALLLLVSLIVLAQAWRGGRGRPFATREQLIPVAKVLGPVTAFVVLTGAGLGLYASAALYLAFYMRWVGRHTWTTVLAVAVLVPVVTFVVFERWFLVPMPKGPLETWLGY